MKFGSVCSGIEAASVAWHPLGWKAAWLAEIEPFPSAVLAHHYPDVPNLGDMTKIAALVRSGEVAAPDILVGGTPCQAFSVAGLRGGLSDPRGALTLAYVELANEIDANRTVWGELPCVVVWENVPGVLSSKDNAFGCFLAGLAGESCELKPPGRKWANAGCVFGPQRAVAWRILDAQYFGVAQRRRRVFVVASAREGFDPAAVLFEFDGVRRDSAPSRQAREGASGSFARSVALRGRDGGATAELGDELAGCLRASSGGGDKPHALAPVGIIAQNGSDVQAGFLHTVGTIGASQACGTSGDVVALPPAIAFDSRQDPVSSERVFGALGSSSPQAQAVAFQSSQSGVRIGDTHATLDANNGPRRHNGALIGMRVRRLTPTECERLQGFPDNYTLISWRKKPATECPDGPRYKALGNSMCTNVMAWIGRRIAASVS